MAVPVQQPFITYAANGVATNFAIPFKLIRASDLSVQLDGNPVSFGYAINGLGNDSSTITFTAAPLGELLLLRDVPLERLTDYQTNGDLLAKTVNLDFDRLWMAFQDMLRRYGRALVRPLFKNYYDAEGRQIKNLAEPTELQDAATRNWAQQYVASILVTGQGPINNAANVVYSFPDGEARNVQSLASSIGAQGIGLDVGVPGAEVTTVANWVGRKTFVDLMDFATPSQIADIKGPSVQDHTSLITKALQYAFSNLPATLVLPKGKINYTSLPNIAKRGLAIKGAGYLQTVLKFKGTGTAVLMDAFATGSASTPFVQACNLEDLTVEGNANTSIIIDAQGIARSYWKNVNLREGEPTAGIAFKFRGVMLSRFENILCSTDLQPMVSVPYKGLELDEGRRAGASIGNSSNNVFTSPYFEGMGIGLRIFRGDQNTFIGGSPESCTVYGALIGSASRFNTFIGTGFENIAATADFADGGIGTKFINCYASNKAVLQGSQSEISGGYYESVTVDALSYRNTVGGITLYHWGTAHGGFLDNGIGTRYGSMRDSRDGSFIDPKRDRFSLTLTGSPFIYKNTTGVNLEIIVQSGTVSQVRQSNGAGLDNQMVDAWLRPAAAGCYLIRPGDKIELSYTGTPQVIALPHNES